MLQRMLNRLRGANDDEKGFTLIELLVVVLIIGILAAIALPTFLGQSDKAKDSSAKSDSRNAVTQVESCFTDAASSPTYGDCVGANTYTGQPDTVTTSVPAGGGLFAAVATSDTGNTFTVTKNADGTFTRSCTGAPKGGCKATADAAGNFW